MKRMPTGKVPDFLRSRVTLPVSPGYWLATARNLRRATNLLFMALENALDRVVEDRSLDDILPDSSACEMLLGFAIENLLKGLYVTTIADVRGVKGMKDLRFPSSRHELHPFADALSQPPLSIRFTYAERDALSLLEDVILWSGRSPSAQTVQAGSALSESDAIKTSRLVYPEGHFAALALYDRLDPMLAALVPPHAPEP